MRGQISNFQKGFTLIEIMVSLTILAVISAVSFAALQSYQKGALLASTSRDVGNDITAARTRSRAGIKPDICISNGTPLTNYIVTLTSSQTYQITVTCGATVFNYPVKSLPGSLFFSTSSTTTISFMPLTGLATFIPATTSGAITICQTSAVCPAGQTVITVPSY